jgi:hypothetical protein
MPPTRQRMKVRLLKKVRKKAQAMLRIQVTYGRQYYIRRYYRDSTGEDKTENLSCTGFFTKNGYDYDDNLGYRVGPFFTHDLEVAKAKLAELRREEIIDLAAKEFLHKQNKQLARI